MKELKEACRMAYIAYVESNGQPREKAVYAAVVAKYIKALKDAGPEAINAYYAWCRGAPDLTKTVKSVETEMNLRNA